MDNLLNWGFAPIGTPLGSESALSMPTAEMTGLENPLEANDRMLQGFAEQTQRRYGNVSDPGGALWDPRGDRALSGELGDYRTTDLMRPDEIPVSIADLSPELLGGDPVLAPYAASNQLDPDALLEAGLGLSDTGAATLADSLSVVDPAILDGIYMPPQVEPDIVNEMGLVTKHGGLPEAFFDSRAGVLHEGIPGAVERVLAAQGEYQYVDENGVVDKYPEGTGPYDAPGMTRPGSVLGAIPGTAIRTQGGIKFGGNRKRLTAADFAASPRLALGAMAPSPTANFRRLVMQGKVITKKTPGGSATGSGLSSDARQQLQSANQDGGSAASFVATTGASQPTQQPGASGLVDNGNVNVYPEDVGGPVDTGEAPVSCPSWNIKCWWPIAAGAGLAALGAYLAFKKGKKGKK